MFDKSTESFDTLQWSLECLMKIMEIIQRIQISDFCKFGQPNQLF